MILKAFSIHDSKAKVFGNPFFAITPGDAERTLHKLTNDPQSMIHQYPHDFSLYALGEYDDQSGEFSPRAPEHLVSAIQFHPEPQKHNLTVTTTKKRK